MSLVVPDLRTEDDYPGVHSQDSPGLMLVALSMVSADNFQDKLSHIRTFKCSNDHILKSKKNEEN